MSNKIPVKFRFCVIAILLTISQEAADQSSPYSLFFGNNFAKLTRFNPVPQPNS